jgi:hypothetical protein
VDINLLLEPRGSESPARENSTHSSQNQDYVLSHDDSLVKETTESGWESRGDPLYDSLAPIAALSKASNSTDLLHPTKPPSGTIAAYHLWSHAFGPLTDSTAVSGKDAGQHRPTYSDGMMPTTYTENNLLPRNSLQHHDFESERMSKNQGEDTADDGAIGFGTPMMHNTNTSAALLRHIRVEDEGLRDKTKSQSSSETATAVPHQSNSGEPASTATNIKRRGDTAVYTNRIFKRGRRSNRDIDVSARKSITQVQKEVDCPVFKHHVMHNTASPCRGCRVGVMAQVRSHLNPSRTATHQGFPAFVQQCSKCKQDFVDQQRYDDHKSASACVTRNQTRGDIAVPWARLYLVLYPNARRIPLPWPNERGWLPNSVFSQCRESQVNTQVSSITPGRFGALTNLTESPEYAEALNHILHDLVTPTHTQVTRSSTPVFNPVPESTSSGPASLDVGDNNRHWLDVLQSFGTQQRTIRQAAGYLTKEQLQFMAAESQRISEISDGMYKYHQGPPAEQEVSPSHGTGGNRNLVNDSDSHVRPDWTRVFPRSRTPEMQHSTPMFSDSAFVTLTQAPVKARNFSVLNHLPSDSGYQSGLGTNSGSVISDISTGSSLGVSKHFVHDFVAFFGDALICRAGAQQWAQFAMAHNSPTEIETRLTALLKAFAIHLATRPTALSLDQSTGHLAQDDPSTRFLLDGAIKLIRTYRPMIARYFLDHSVSSEGGPISLYDHLQGLGHHFSLAERVDLLVHQGIHENDDEDEDNIVDEDIIAQLETVQAMLVSGDAFRDLASELRRSLYRDDEYRTASIRAIVLGNDHSFDTACWTTAGFLAKWDVMGFMRSQYSKLPSVASIMVLTGSALYAQATTCGDYVRTNWPMTGSIVLDLIDKALESEAERTSALVLGMYTLCHTTPHL